VALLAILAMRNIGDAGLVARIEGSLLDARFRLRPAPLPDRRIVVLAIDDNSIERIGRWPWSRSVLARTLDLVATAHPALIAFDLLLTEPETAADPDFARAIAAANPVLLPFDMATSAGAPLPEWLSRFEYGRLLGDPRLVPGARGLRLPVEALAQSAAALGHVRALTDPGGALRYDYSMLRVGEALYPSLVIEAVRILRGVARQNVVVQPADGIDLGGLPIRTGPGMRLMVEAYPAGRFKVISIADLLYGQMSKEDFAGRLVLIGATATGLGDHFATPFNPALPGVLLNAAAISGLLDGHVLRHDDLMADVDALLVLLACLVVGLAGCRSLRRGLAGAGIMALALPAIDASAFIFGGWWLSAAVPLAAVGLNAVVLVFLYHGRGVSALREVWAASRRDTLTGLPNRAGLNAWVEAATAGRYLLCAADLDGFKQVNDLLGHPAGDDLLCQVATRLRDALRPGDFACRISGDEFLLALRAPSGADDVGAWETVHLAMARVRTPYELAAGPARVGISMGVAIWPDDDPFWARVREQADVALYVAKRAGKGNVLRAGPRAALGPGHMDKPAGTS